MKYLYSVSLFISLVSSSVLASVKTKETPFFQNSSSLNLRKQLPQVKIVGRQLWINEQPFAMQAICWNPVRKGQAHPDGLMFRNPSDEDLRIIERDFQMMKSIGVNTLRTYEPILDERVLRLVDHYELYMIVPALNYYATPFADIESRVRLLKDHPRTLLWEIGNEWNYNQFYSQPQNPIGFEGARDLVQRAAQFVRQIDQRLPISTVYGELPDAALVDSLRDIDIWAINVYSGLSFGKRFEQWLSISSKPLYIGEYGADAINRTTVDESAQELAVVKLSQEISRNLSARDSTKILIGGSLFEWSDEWWKDPNGRLDQQDIGGIAPGGGPYPDQVFNEEYWGIVDIDRHPRKAYEALLQAQQSQEKLPRD